LVQLLVLSGLLLVGLLVWMGSHLGGDGLKSGLWVGVLDVGSLGEITVLGPGDVHRARRERLLVPVDLLPRHLLIPQSRIEDVVRETGLQPHLLVDRRPPRDVVRRVDRERKVVGRNLSALSSTGIHVRSDKSSRKTLVSFLGGLP
jgi:hypothetical protein